ncbi:universal stress protein [Streptomyces sp. NPDC096538]|uniref:universal stress protein n=1 Tax=Streptomyces sp. NPDC096538 TaxID=3155427 RepID=UPI00332C21EA
MFKRILLAIDPSSSRIMSVRMAGDLARLTGASVHVVHVVAATATFDTVIRLEDDTDAKRILDEAVTTLRSEGIEANGTLVNGLLNEVPGAIIAAADQYRADLIILSPHHRGAVAALFNPRVSDAVSHASRTAVLLTAENSGAANA